MLVFKPTTDICFQILSSVRLPPAREIAPLVCWSNSISDPVTKCPIETAYCFRISPRKLDPYIDATRCSFKRIIKLKIK